ncbi:MAG: N-acetylmuramoyl-L-alanine amidase family protein [Limnochordia bacterium]
MAVIEPGNTTKLLFLLLIWYALIRAGVPVEELPDPVPADPPHQSEESERDPPSETIAVLADKVVVLDPGHGGNEPGAIGVTGSREKDNTLAAAMAIKNVLEDAGAKVVLTRDGDYEPNLHLLRPGASLTERLHQRVRIADQQKADVFISIHNDWNPNPAIRGITTYYWNSPRLATCVHDGLIDRTGARSVGVIKKGFYVIVEAPMPALLVELGFLSNDEDEKLLCSSRYHTMVGEGIRDGLIAYFGG